MAEEKTWAQSSASEADVAREDREGKGLVEAEAAEAGRGVVDVVEDPWRLRDLVGLGAALGVAQLAVAGVRRHVPVPLRLPSVGVLLPPLLLLGLLVGLVLRIVDRVVPTICVGARRARVRGEGEGERDARATYVAFDFDISETL